MTEAELRSAVLKSMEVLEKLGPKIQWLHSYVTDDKVYCVYLAPDEETILEHARMPPSSVQISSTYPPVVPQWWQARTAAEAREWACAFVIWL